MPQSSFWAAIEHIPFPWYNESISLYQTPCTYVTHFCHHYFSAIDADIEHIPFHLARCGILERLGDARAALRGYKRLLGGEEGLPEWPDHGQDGRIKAVLVRNGHFRYSEPGQIFSLALKWLNMTCISWQHWCKYGMVNSIRLVQGRISEDTKGFLEQVS